MNNVIQFAKYRKYRAIPVNAPITKFDFVGVYFMLFSFIGIMLTAVSMFL